MSATGTQEASPSSTTRPVRPPAAGGWLRLEAARLNTFRALRHRDYRLYFFGQLVSVTGSWMQTTAVTWLAYALTGKSEWAAIILAAQLLPVFFLGPWGGVMADRLPKRWLIFATQTIYMVLAFVLAGMVFTDSLDRWGLLFISLATGLVNALDLPARLAFVTDMAGRDDLMNAVALNSLLFNAARVLGPALAGVAFRYSGAGTCFLANGVSFLAVLWALAVMKVDGRSQTAHSSRRRTLPQLLEGFRYLGPRPGLTCLVVAATVLCLTAWPMLVLLPAFSRDNLHADVDGYSGLLIWMGLGALVGALTVATFGSLARRRRFLGGGFTTLTAGLIGLSFATSAATAGVYCALIGFGLILFFVTGQSILQLSADDSNRGRVMAVWAMTQTGAMPLGNWLSGMAADRFGVPVVLCAGGIGCVVAVLILLLALRYWTARQRRQVGGPFKGLSAAPIPAGTCRAPRHSL